MAFCFGDSLVGTSGTNGDAFYISPDYSTILFADGASGAGNDGKVTMSRCCVRNVEEFPFFNSGLSPQKYIDELIWKINNELIHISQKNNKCIFGTLVIRVINDDTATFASIGDSPAFVISENNVERIAKTKKTYDILVQMGLFTEKQLDEYVHKLPEHMWSMFDTFIPMVVPKYALEECRLQDGDIVAICCDGVSDYLSTNELLQLIDSDDLPKSVDTIIAQAKNQAIEEHKRNQYDDITVVLYQHKNL